MRPRRSLAAAIVLCLIGGIGALAGGVKAGVLPPDQLSSRLLKFTVTGSFVSYDPATSTAVFEFSGPFYATTVDPATGVVDDASGPHLGEMESAVVSFHLDFSQGLTDSRFTCGSCRMVFDDGSVLEPLVDTQAPLAEQNVPMEGRLLFELGPVPGGDLATQRFRGIGCGGTKETAGAGALANQKGAICLNGVFAFSKDLSTITDPAALVGVTGIGESNCTLVFHPPAPGF